MVKNVVIDFHYYYNCSFIILFYTKNSFLHLEIFVLAHPNLLWHKGHFFPYFFSYKVIS